MVLSTIVCSLPLEQLQVLINTLRCYVVLEQSSIKLKVKKKIRALPKNCKTEGMRP